MENKSVENFHKKISSDKNILEKILKDVKSRYGENVPVSAKNSIVEEIILPFAKELGYSFSAQELTDYIQTATQNQAALTDDELEDVAGGLGARGAAVLLGAIMGLSALSGTVSSFAAGPGTAGASSISTSISTTVDLQSGNKQLDEKTIFEESIRVLERAVDDIAKDGNLDYSYNASVAELHSADNTDLLSTHIEKFETASKTVAQKFFNNSTLEDLKELISKKPETLSELLQKTSNDSSINIKTRVAMGLILDDWASINGFEHNFTNCIASPYFIDDGGSVMWPKNGGYDASGSTNVIDNLSIGAKIDRYGDEFGTYVSPIKQDGTSSSFEERGLSQRENKKIYNIYEITRNFDEFKNVPSELGIEDIETIEKEVWNEFQNIKSKIKPSLIKNINFFNYSQLTELIKNTPTELAINTADEAEILTAVGKIKAGLDDICKKFDDKISMSSGSEDMEKIKAIWSTYKLGFISVGYMKNINEIKGGKIAPAFKKSGGGEQIQLPCAVFLLKSLMFLKSSSA